jgi:hypothetical protein
MSPMANQRRAGAEQPEEVRSGIREGGWAAERLARRPLRSTSPRGSRQASTLMTTRRFCARPARVLFGAIGLSSP